MHQKIFTYCIIGMMVLSSFSESITALEGIDPIHTLDELPFSSEETDGDIRRDMLSIDIESIKG